MGVSDGRPTIRKSDGGFLYIHIVTIALSLGNHSTAICRRMSIRRSNRFSPDSPKP